MAWSPGNYWYIMSDFNPNITIEFMLKDRLKVSIDDTPSILWCHHTYFHENNLQLKQWFCSLQSIGHYQIFFCQLAWTFEDLIGQILHCYCYCKSGKIGKRFFLNFSGASKSIDLKLPSLFTAWLFLNFS